ncbi:DNRLRE domain-containing protein [Pseudactinotalea suaedae]|uniref:DNRLRE domain-containing protein n=1 Tax=Pseudactinotalea suaedae TaxID=1524924 RepID=UPI0013912CC9|nr:DNRLRE domain-containing protein [Pseudactinotalea suaedae]
MAESNGRVVVGGSFTQIRPGAGQSGTARNVAGVAILDAATGTPTTCQLPLTYSAGTAIAYAVAASPDGDTVFVGGVFTGIGGVSRARLAEIDVVSCTVTAFRAPSISSTVQSIAVADDAVYIGGRFQTIGGQQRRSFAKLNRAGALQPFVANAYGATQDAYSQTVVPDKNAQGTAMVLSPEGDRLVIGGDFFTVNGTATHSFAVVDTDDGSLVRGWPANTVGNTSRTKTLVSDGVRFYVGNEGYNGFDGSIAYNWSDYSQAWRDNCAGATQAMLVHDDVIFKAHHYHDCGAMGMFPDGRRIYLTASLADDPTQWQLGWLPELNDGIGEHLGPRALEVATGSNGQEYLWVSGEFTRVNGANQQSLTRFSGNDTGAPPTPSAAARVVEAGSIQVNILSVYDRDDSDITYAVYRNGGAAPIWTGVGKSQHWYRNQLTFVDTNVTPGTTYSYRVRAIDAAGNQSGLSGTVSATASATGSAYAAAVLADDPRLFYRYDDVNNSTWVIDSSGETVVGLNGIAENGVSRTAAGAIAGDPSRSATFNDTPPDGGYSQYIWNDLIENGPTQYSIETWFRTTSTTGGALVNYGSYQGRPRSDNGDDRTSNTVDRVVYMESTTGRLRFGVRSGPVQTLRTDAAYNDGQWHHVVATQGPEGMRLYVDGAVVGQNAVTGNQTYRGTWHVGGDNIGSYPNTGFQAAQRYFDGQLDETAVYYHPLTAEDVSQHFTAAAPDTTAPSVPGVPEATVDADDVALSWSASSDAVGVTGYAVYRGTTADFTANASSRIAQVTGTSYTDEARPAGTWFYKVTAVDAAGNVSGASAAGSATVEAPAPDTTAPSVPGVPTASVDDADVALSWSASSDAVGVTGYAVYRGTTAGFTANASSRIAEVTGTSYTDEARPAGTWFYKVTAVDAAGNVSGASGAGSATVEAPAGEPVVQTVGASADTMVAAVSPGTVYGTSTQLSARGQTAIWSFLRFELPEAPAGYALSGATLQLVTSTDPTATSADAHQVHLVDQPWSEATNWNTRPTGVASGVLGVLTGASALSTAYTVSLSTAELASAAGDSVTLRLSSATGTDNIRVLSRETATTSRRPSLTLTYSPLGGPDATAPSVPAGVAASLSGADVSLSWSASSDDVGVTGYAVYRGTTAGFAANASSLIGEVTGTSFVDEARPEGTWYYRVTAADAAGNVSGASGAASVTVTAPETPDTTAPSVPGGVVASVDGANVALTWSASTDDVGVTGYAVYRGTTAAFTADASSRIGQITSTSYNDPSRPEGTWYYRVSATDAAGNVSGASAGVAAVVAGPVGEPVVQTVVTDADTMVAAVNPANVYGSSTQISARSNTAIWSFLRFQLPAAPEGYVLSSASLRLVTSSDPTATSGDAHQVHLVDQPWSEATTTWANRPTEVASGVLGQLTGASALVTAYTVSLSTAELAALAGGPATLRLSSETGTDNVRLLARETGSAGSRPSLTLTYVEE